MQLQKIITKNIFLFTLKDTRKLKKSKRMIKNAKQKPSVNCEDKGNFLQKQDQRF